MGAPSGNEYWKLRNKHGRNPIYSEPTELQKKVDEYFRLMDNEYWIKEDFIKSGPDAGKIIEIRTKTPYTIGGLCEHLGVHPKYFDDYIETLENMDDKEKAKDLSEIVSRTLEKIDRQKIEGAMVGAYNPLITARILGLKDKQDITTNDKDFNVTVNLTKEEARNIAESLDNDL